MLTLSGYRILEELPRRGATACFRGLRRADGVAVSILVADTGSEDATRLDREYAMAAGLGILGVVEPLMCESHGGQVVLVRAKCGGRPLADLIPPGGMPLPEALRIAASVARTLGELHRRQRLHLGLTPETLLVDPSGQAFLTGFGQAESLADPRPERRRPPHNPAYMAPEQTGRTSGEIGAGADLYALGVILFQLLTSELPFRVKDPLEWFHCHIARIPELPRGIRPAIPQALEQVVLRLLAKTPEERYRSATGLAWDLLDCAARIEAGGDWNDFRPGARDTAPTLAIPAHLYGRESERKTLLDAWHRAITGRAELLLVSGPAGFGKSSLVDELHPVADRDGGYFIAGKFDLRNRATPYFSLIQALHELIRKVLAEPDERLSYWREKLHATLGANGRVIVDTIHQAALVLGPQPPLQELPPVETKIRFQRTLHDFICAFAEAGRPLAIFLDDLQWADTPSLELLSHLLSDADTRHLLVIGAYRDNEVDDIHPLHGALEQISASGVQRTDIKLAALAGEEVAALLDDTLHNPEAGELVELVRTKTAGNPLFVRQFLLDLCDKGLLTLDAQTGGWVWDMARIDAAELGDDVAELMAQRLQRLSPQARHALRIAACIGNRFAIATVAAVAGCGRDDIAAVLAEAIREGMITVAHGSGTSDEGILRFGHDRIQQAAYALQGKDERNALHLAAGRALLARSDLKSDAAFEIANQFQYCLELITDAAERRQLATIYAQVGMRAKATAAYGAARAYLETGAKLAGDGLWQTDPALAMQLFADHAECEFLCGNADVAETLFGRVLERAREAGDIARLHVLRMHLYFSRGRSDRALAEGQLGLRRLGVNLPSAPGKGALVLELARIAAGLRGRRIEDLAALPAMTDPLQQAVMQLYMNMTVAAYFVNRDLLALITMRMVSLSMRHGNTGTSPYAYVTFGMVIGGGFGRYREGFRFGELGRRLGEDSGDVRYRGLSLAECGIFTGAWGQPLGECVAQLRRAGRDLLDCGNLMMANYTAIATVFALDGKGEALPALTAEVQRQGEFVRKIGFHDSAHYFLSAQRKILCLQGGTEAPGSLAGTGYDEARQLAELRGMTEQTALAWHLVNRLQVAYLFGQYEAAKTAADQLEVMREVSIAQLYVPRQLFYAALTELALAAGKSDAARRANLRKAARYMRRLRALATSCAANYRHLDLLLAAEYAAVCADASAAQRFDRAVKAAAESGHAHDWALANERAAASFLRLDVRGAASQYLRDACIGYRQWGADALAQAIERRHAGIALPAADASPAPAPIDMAAIINASQALSGEIEFGGLVRRLMETLATHAGGARVMFILKRDNGFQIEDEWRAGEESPRCAGPIPLERCVDIAHTVVQYAAHTLSDVVIDDASRDNAFATDAYLAGGRQKSVLCLPIVRHGGLLGLIYMENPLLRGAFHHERLRVLHLLAAQLAISIENTGLYERLTRASQRLEEANRGLEEKVAARTSELSDEIVERKRMEAALRDATQAAEAANRAKSAFLANMSHEIRTPMNAIIGLSQLALRTELTTRQYGYLKKIDSAAELLLGLINDILDMAKIEAGKMSLETIAFDIDDVMAQVTDIMEMAAHEKGLELVVHRSRDIPRKLMGDPMRLGQILLNLANNAVKFTNSGEIRLAAERERFDEAADEIVLRFSISDTGIGLNGEQLDRLFQPFTQADMSVTRTHGGTGLGLTIVKQLVQLMGGAVEVDSAPGAGSVFSFTARFGPAPHEAHAEDPAAPDYTAMHVLVVDDNDSARLALQHVLEAAGCRVTTVPGGAEAIAALRAADPAAPYKLVLMDWNMPGMDGIEAARRIQRDPAIPERPVVVMVTAYSREEVTARAAHLETAIDAYLLKPVKPAALFDAITGLFGLERAEAAPPVAQAGAEPVAMRFTGCRILVVEDNTYNQLVARELLESAGFAVDIAENGREAIDRVRRAAAPYDAVLMDVQMPVMDGWAATRELRRHEQTRALPIFGMTAYTMKEDLDRCRDAGMDDVITKPVRIDKLLSLLAARLETDTAPADSISPVPHPGARARETAVINTEAALRWLGNNRDLHHHLMKEFRDKEAGTARALQLLVEADDLEAAGKLVHGIRNTALILGLDRFTEVAGEIERALRQDDSQCYQPLLASFAHELAESIQACSQLLAMQPDMVSTPAPGATAMPPDDTLQPLLNEFSDLLARNHMDALKHMPRLHELLHGTHLGGTVGDIRACLDRLDFSGARLHFGKLAALSRSGEHAG